MKRPQTFHPFVFALYPILSLFVNNIEQLNINIIILPSIFMVIIMAIMWRLLFFVFKNNEKAAILTSVSILLFFSYGYFSGILCSFDFFGFSFLRNRYRAGLYVSIIVLVICLVPRIKEQLSRFNWFLNISALILMFLLLANIGMNEINKITLMRRTNNNYAEEKIDLHPEYIESKNYPDIYYIILDGYANSKTLKEILGYSNEGFLKRLAQKGFYVAINSTSNYASTSLSLTSSLNMKYICSKKDFPGSGEEDEVVNYLSKKGYKIVDISKEINMDKASDSSGFIIMLIKSTLIDAIAHRLNLYEDFVRKEVLSCIDGIENRVPISGPKYIFCRIPSPHPPYVFGQNGESVNMLKPGVQGDIFLSSWDDKKAYLDQLIFISKRTEKLVDVILKRSKSPPIILIQSDHGPHFTAKASDEYKITMKNFNAHYLPLKGKKMFYDSMTPVNTFRVLFNYYFGENYKILKDLNYYSTLERPFDFVDVTKYLK